jgi:hypothetical protein
MKLSVKMLLASVAFASLASCSKEVSQKQNKTENNSLTQTNENSNAALKPEAIVIKAAGDINDALNQFRDLLGGGQPNTAPGATGGRREVNWDGVPAAFTNNNLFPRDFFGSFNPADANGRKRGLIYTTPGTGFSISDTNFADINSTYGEQFKAFSPKKTFIAVGSIITDNFFKIPGTNIFSKFNSLLLTFLSC